MSFDWSWYWSVSTIERIANLIVQSFFLNVHLRLFMFFRLDTYVKKFVLQQIRIK